MTLEDRLEQGLPDAWRPDEQDPDILIGEVVSVEQGTSDFGPYPLLVIKQDDGTEKALHAFQTVLRNELIRQRPQPGERIGIKYLGKQQSKPGSKYGSYTGYRVKVERDAGAAFDWSKIGTEPDPDDAQYAPPVVPAVTVPDDAGDDGVPF